MSDAERVEERTPEEGAVERRERVAHFITEGTNCTVNRAYLIADRILDALEGESGRPGLGDALYGMVMANLHGDRARDLIYEEYRILHDTPSEPQGGDSDSTQRPDVPRRQGTDVDAGVGSSSDDSAPDTPSEGPCHCTNPDCDWTWFTGDVVTCPQCGAPQVDPDEAVDRPEATEEGEQKAMRTDSPAQVPGFPVGWELKHCVAGALREEIRNGHLAAPEGDVGFDMAVIQITNSLKDYTASAAPPQSQRRRGG